MIPGGSGAVEKHSTRVENSKQRPAFFLSQPLILGVRYLTVLAMVANSG